MPSGSKKRKSSKKPKPQGDPPELDAGLEEAMENTGEVVGEATPSPRGIEGDPEAMAARALDGNEVNGEVLQEGAKEDSQIDEAAPDRDVDCQGDPPPQTEPEPEIPASVEVETPAVNEPEGETAQQGTDQIETPVLESEAKNCATPEEIKSQVGSDAVPVDSEPVADATPGASPDEIKADAVIGLDEIGSSNESTNLEREFELDAAPLGSESGNDESFVGAETKTDAASADIEPEIDKAPDELDAAAAPAQVELEIAEPLVEVKPEVDAAPYIEQETDEALDEVPEPETDGVAAEIKPEEPETVAPADIEPGTEEALRGRELVTDAAPTDVETEGEETQVEKPETATPGDIKPGTEEASRERELVTDAALTDVEAEGEETQVEEPEIADPGDIKPETEETLMERELVIDAAPTAEVEESPAEKELATGAATADVEPETVAAPVDIDAEMNTAQVETDALQDEVPGKIDASIPENETETDVAVREFESEADAAVVELEPPTEASPVEIEPEVSAEPAFIEAAPEPELQVEALVEGEPEVNAEDVGAPEPEPEVEALVEEELAAKPEPEVEALVEEEPEVSAEDVENSAEIEARMAPPQETDTEPKPLDLTEETSFDESPQDIEPELESEAIEKAKQEDEARVETKAEERGSVETESYQLDFVEGEVEAAPEINPEPEVETTRGIEAEVPLEAEPQSVLEAPSETEIDEKGLIHTQADQQDLVEIEPDQSGVKECDEQLQNQEGEPEIGELESSVSEDNQPSESQPQVAEASEVPVVEAEPPCISASDDDTSSASSSEASDNAPKERTAIEPELEEDDDIAPSATTFKGESTIGVVSENQDSGGDIEQTSGTAVDNEQGAADELPAESKEDISEGQEKAVDVGHDEYGAVLASSGNDGETKESKCQELAIELPPADLVNMEELAKEDITDQERAVDIGHGEDEVVLASIGNGGEAEVSSEQELGSSEQPLPDVVDVEECAKEGLLASDQEPVTEQPQPLIDEQDLSMGLDAAAEPSSVESEQSLNATLFLTESTMTSDTPEPLDEAATPASSEKVALEHKLNLESATGEPERDIEDEEVASSTVAEAGSVLNDFDERSSYELPTYFLSTEQDADVPECQEFDDNLSTAVPEPVETGSREQLDSEPFPAEKVDANTVCQVEATSEQPEVLLENAEEPFPGEKVDANTACQVEATSEQPEVLLDIAEATKPGKVLHSAPIEEMPRDEQVPPSPQPVQVVQDSGKDEVQTTKEVVLTNEEPRTGKEERAACEDDKVAANSILGTSFPIVVGDELISKAFIHLENGQRRLASSEAPSNELVEHRDESSFHQGEATNMDKAEIHAMVSKESREVEHNPMGGEANSHGDDAPVEFAPPISEGRDIKDVQAFHRESTREESLPVVISTQDRAVDVNLKNAERPSGGGALQRRTKFLDCCGMFDLLLKKN